ncbi:MAG: DUF192 domain-containing protein [Rhodomicrobium sp.]|nr:DUF192 domain-containing protein [Rhodomicrobium sp.]
MGWLRISLRRTDVTSSVASVGLISRAVVAALFLLGGGVSSEVQAALEKQPLSFLTDSGKHTITVEVADTEAARNTGLMFRQSLGDNEGMIFIYPNEQPISMWMRNTYISLDMIFVRANGVISRIETGTEPFSERVIESGGNVLAVIEMKAGSAARLGLKPGGKVIHPAFK